MLLVKVKLEIISMQQVTIRESWPIENENFVSREKIPTHQNINFMTLLQTSGKLWWTWVRDRSETSQKFVKNKILFKSMVKANWLILRWLIQTQ